jgi:uncharacterized repeat protein (TIGR03803 family)
VSFQSRRIERSVALLLALALASSPAALARTVVSDDAKDLSVLYAFQGLLDGASPVGGVTLGPSGVIFGTTSAPEQSGFGTIFALIPAGDRYAHATLYRFAGPPDGSSPTGNVLEDASGNLFTTTQRGGRSNSGTAVALSPGAAGYRETERFSFKKTDGTSPVDGFVASGSVLYATASEGGKFGYGAIVAFTLPGFKEHSVYDFTGGDDGGAPRSGLVRDGDGALYGTTFYGGAAGYGVVFRFVPSGRNGTEDVVWTFGTSSQTDGEHPQTSVLLDGDGNIYGTTQYGGSNALGVVFKLSPESGGYVESILHDFGGPADGSKPSSGLTVSGGLLYGVTSIGGADNDGTIFEISPTGAQYAVVHDFEGTDGAYPRANLYPRGNALYGETTEGGPAGFGVVFRFVP